MDFSWSKEQLAFADEVGAFATTELVHDVAQHERDARLPLDLWRKCAAFGLLGLNQPEEFGGSGHDVLTSVLALERLGYGCRNSGLLLAVNAQIWTVQRPLLDFGTAEQQMRYLPRLISGACIGVQAVTEAEAGSDAGSLSMRAEACTEGYRLNGTKVMITGAPLADVALVLANTHPERGRWGISSFLVELDQPGVTRGPSREKLGLQSVPFGDLDFTDCVVPATARLGPEGAGLSLLNAALEWERTCMLASFLGVMQRQFEAAVEYVRGREQFGSPVGSFQAVSHRIADMRVRLETSRLLLYRAAWLKQEGLPAALEAAMVKLHLGECFVESSMDAIRGRGGYGYLSENDPQRDLRDAIGGTLYGGTSDIQRNLIAKLSGV